MELVNSRKSLCGWNQNERLGKLQQPQNVTILVCKAAESTFTSGAHQDKTAKTAAVTSKRQLNTAMVKGEIAEFFA